MTTINETLKRSDGSTAVAANVRISVAGAGGIELPAAYTSAGSIVRPFTTRTDGEGAWTATLPASADLIPSGAVYRVTLTGAGVDGEPRYLSVPDSATPVAVVDCLVDPPGAIDPPGLAALAARVAAIETFLGTATFLTLGE